MLTEPLNVGDKIKCIQNNNGMTHPLTIGKIYEIIAINTTKYSPYIGYDIIWDDNTVFTFMIGSDAARLFFEMVSETTEINYLDILKGY